MSRLKIKQHPRMRDVAIGDEVLCYPQQLVARVEEVFPAAVCVRLSILSVNGCLRFLDSRHLWRADDIENLSVCRMCGCRDDLELEHGTGIPFRLCAKCRAGIPEDERAAPEDERAA